MNVEETKYYMGKIGVDSRIMNFIDSLEPDKQEGILRVFLEIVEDEILFVLAMQYSDWAQQYLNEKACRKPLVM